MSEKQFAFGRNEVSGCECPAIAAGFEPASSDGSLVAAEMYDDEVRELGVFDYKGIIEENIAKKAWESTIDRMERMSYGDEESVRVAKEIAKELGWT